MTSSKIEWTDRSDWNPIRGCTRVSPGCGAADGGGCYAEVMAARFSKPGQWGHGFAHMVGGDHRWTGKVELQEDRLTLPLTWRKPAKIFVSSTSDVFHEKLSDSDIDKIFAVMALAPQHTFQVLTKRANRMRAYLCDPSMAARVILQMQTMFGPGWPRWLYGGIRDFSEDGGFPLPNVWLGVSVEDQQRADERIPDLLATPAAVRFLSCEPLLGPVDIGPWISGCYECADTCGCRLAAPPPEIRCRKCGFEGADDYSVWGDGPIEVCPSCSEGDNSEPVCPECGTRMVFDHPDTPCIDWVIAGGESGCGARDNGFEENARAILSQCRAAGVPFFGKQNVKKAPLSEDLMVREFPHAQG